ncbi:putative LOG family protein [Dioscorea sansibarensis]
MEKEKGISMSKFKKTCVYCGSSQGKKKSYQDVAIDLAKELIIGVTVGEVKQVVDKHQRKARMARHSDAFIVLPGGYGTLEELFEVITWAQLGNKPVGLLNIDGYYNSLFLFIDQAVKESFIKPTTHHTIISASNAKELVEKLEEYSACHEGVVPKLNWECKQLEHSQIKEISS